MIRFSSARLYGDWVGLTPFSDDDFTTNGYGEKIENAVPFPCPRGLDVRLSEIAWVADAPEGS